MSLARSTTGACFIVFLLGAALAAPTTPSSGTQTDIERDSQGHNGLPLIKTIAERNSTESATTNLGDGLSAEFREESDCQTAWKKFMVDFDVEYASDTEAQKRRKIFCANWKGIQEHNVQYELGKVSFKKRINQWADLTFEEWKNKQRPVLAPEFTKAKPTTEATEVDLRRTNCQSAWKKFLSDFNRIYENDDETEMRRSIFCDNWQRIQEHNLKYETGKVSHKKSINEWSDLKFEEWKKMQEPRFPLSMQTPGNQTEPPKAHEYPNTEEPGTYVAETSKLVNEVHPVEVPSQITEIEDQANKELSGKKNVTSQLVRFPGCQSAWEKFITDFDRKYENDAETERRRTIFCGNWKRIQEHNALYESGKVSHKKGINQWSDLKFEEWRKMQEPHFPPNMEISGNKTTEAEGQLVKLQIDPKDIEEQANKELPGSKGKETVMKEGSQQIRFPSNFEKSETYIVKTKASEVNPKNIKCQEAWKKFLIDYSPKYENDVETEKRRSIFCNNLQVIQEHNVQYELGKVSHKRFINQWSDLTSEELKSQSPNILPPNLPPSENKTLETVVEVGSQQVWFPPNMEEPGTYVAETPLNPKLVIEEQPIEVPSLAPEVDKKGINCQSAWEKFITDFDRKYESDAEAEKRRGIFCGNWKRIQEHNLKYEEGKVSHKKGINQWSDLTFEEWRKMQEPRIPLSVETPVNTKASEIDQKGINCQAAWKKFITDFDRKYENDTETEKRRTIFCGNWKRIQEHNALYESGKVSHKKSINQWSDLTFEEWRKMQEPHFPPNMETSGNKTKATEEQGYTKGSRYTFPPNMEEPGTYVAETTLTPKLVNGEQPVEVPSQTKETKEQSTENITKQRQLQWK